MREIIISLILKQISMNPNSKKIFIGLLLFFLCFSLTKIVNAQVLPKPYANATSVNAVTTWGVKRPLTTVNSVTTNTNAAEVEQSVEYMDGLGRPLQAVKRKMSPQGKDMIALLLYDTMGRQSLSFLPYTGTTTDGSFRTNPFQEQKTFDSTYYLGQNQTWFYGITKHEPSSLNRVTEQFAPGNSWAGSSNQSTENNRRSIKIKYYSSSLTDSVQKWKVTEVSGDFGHYSIDGSYSDRELIKIIRIDEHGKQKIVFMDKQGKVILKKVQTTSLPDEGTGKGHSGWLNTYYIYDDLDRLRCVLQPEGFKTLALTFGEMLSSAVLQGQCFRYEYDGRGRVIMQKEPDRGRVEMVYDKRDRLILSRDSALKSQGYWLVNKYDGFNRPKQTGLLYNNFTRTRHQDSCNNNINYPTSVGDVMQENYYDDYSWITSPTPQAGIGSTMFTVDNNSNYFITTYNASPYYAQKIAADYTNVRGKQTGSRVRVIGTSTFMHSVIFYDSVGRVVQTRGANVTTGGYDIETFQYDFSGKVLRKLHRQEKGWPVGRYTRAVSKYAYDHAGRLISVTKKVSNSGTDKVIIQNTYDEAGRLKTKELGPSLETQQFDYNIRGWLLGVNRASLTKTTQPTARFSYELAYDNVTPTITPGSYGTAQYNGNISGLMWRSTGDWENRKYNFTYDQVNRLLKADFTQFSNANNQFDVSAQFDYSVIIGDGTNIDSAYDGNGNIRRMRQSGFTINSSIVIDDLRYTYVSGSNKLLKVVDSQNDPNSRLGDFKEPSSAGDDYTYDFNGNLKSDNNKGISTILYTHLNTPYEVRIPGKGKILYTYDGYGNKLKKEVFDSTGTNPKKTTWVYLKNFVYKNDTMQFFVHEAGRARYDTTQTTGEATKFEWDYFVNDHLGNTRMVLTEQKDTISYVTLTFENENFDLQQAIWENAAGGNIALINRNSRPTNFGTAGSNGSYAKLIAKSTGPIGAAKLLKVMAGDRIHTQIDYFYWTTNTDNSGANGIGSLLTSFATSLVASAQVSPIVKSGASTLASALSSNTDLVNLLNTPNQTSGSNNAPKAYLNILFFDEQLKFDENASQVIPVGYLVNSRGTLSRMMANAVEAKKNGYVYVYFSNESETLVYFDNFMLTHELGPLREEMHYYPFGLMMAAISSKAFSEPLELSKFKYQSQELETSLGLNMYEFEARQYDPQIGRWVVPDPANQFNNISSYAGMGNNPISYVDPDGRFILGTVLGFVGGLVKSIFSGGLEFWNADKQYFKDAWNDFGSSVSNGFKIDKGLWQGSAKQILSRLTWELPNTLLGYGYSSAVNGLQNVRSVSYWGGATAVEKFNGEGKGVTLGSYIIGGRGLDADPNNPLFQHEYGHYLQSQSSGIFYLSKYGIPSLLSKKPHNLHPVEQDANARAFRYFNTHINGYNGWKFKGPHANPIVGYNDALGYHDPGNQEALNRAKLGLSWYDFLLWKRPLIGALINTLILNSRY